MNSSMRRLAQVRSDLVTPRIWPCSSNSMTGSGKIEVDAAPLFAALVHQPGKVAHALEVCEPDVA